MDISLPIKTTLFETAFASAFQSKCVSRGGIWANIQNYEEATKLVPQINVTPIKLFMAFIAVGTTVTFLPITPLSMGVSTLSTLLTQGTYLAYTLYQIPLAEKIYQTYQCIFIDAISKAADHIASTEDHLQKHEIHALVNAAIPRLLASTHLFSPNFAKPFVIGFFTVNLALNIALDHYLPFTSGYIMLCAAITTYILGAITQALYGVYLKNKSEQNCTKVEATN